MSGVKRWVIGMAALAWGAAPATAAPLSATDAALYADAFAAYAQGRVQDGYALAWAAEDDRGRRIYEWLLYQRPDAAARFADIAAFIRARPDWPRMRTLRRRAEETLDASVSDPDAAAFFEDFPPISSEGVERYAAILARSGDDAAAARLVGDFWRTATLGATREREFLAATGRWLTSADHRARLEEKLWAGEREQAQRMLARVDDGPKRIGQARLALQKRANGVDAAVARVPTALQRDEGLIFDRARFRRRRGDLLGAYALVKDVAMTPERRKIWWTERRILARLLLRDGRYREAQIVAANHGLESGVGFAEGEFLSGWLLTRFLDAPLEGYRNFATLFHGVRSPISQSRGAYWAGRASEAVGDQALADRWYAVAAQHGATYYGQLAQARTGVTPAALVAPGTAASAADHAALDAYSMAQAIDILIQIGATQHVRSFFYALRDDLRRPGEGVALAERLERAGLTRLALAMAKTLARRGVLLKRPLYPTPRSIADGAAGAPEMALVLALIRQESAFDDQAVSHAGARGLMQLMPQTAKTVARGLGLPYSRARLTQDPAYNMTLGKTYLSQRLERFDGSYPLALAAYNAGAGRVDRWVEEFGDPRSPHVDPVDWVERIPFGETRNYVMRILESVQVYRRVLGRAQLAGSLKEDLRR